MFLRAPFPLVNASWSRLPTNAVLNSAEERVELTFADTLMNVSLMPDMGNFNLVGNDGSHPLGFHEWIDDHTIVMYLDVLGDPGPWVLIYVGPMADFENVDGIEVLGFTYDPLPVV